MNPIELITALPKWKWKPQSENEISITGVELVAKSDFVWRVGNVAVVGFNYTSLTSPPWMWFALADNVGIRDLVDFRRCARMIPKGTLTAVNVDFAVGLKFAKLYEFEETGTVVEDCGHSYRIMRKR